MPSRRAAAAAPQAPSAPQRPLAKLRARAHWLVIAAAVIGVAVVADGCLEAYPHSADEYAYLYQARTFLHGRVANAPAPYPRRMRNAHIISDERSMYSKYPPGWPAVLALGDAVGAPELVNPLLAGLLLVLVFAFARRISDDDTALVLLLLLASSSFFVLNSSSFYAHTLTALGATATVYFLWRHGESGRTRDLVAAAACWGGTFLTRPFSAVMVAVALLPAVVLHVRRRRAWRPLLAAAVVGAVAVGAYLLYNRATTGDPLTYGHVVRDPNDVPNQENYPRLGTLSNFADEYGQVALPLVVPALAAALLYALRRRAGVPAPRHLAVALLVVAATWLGYGMRNPPIPIHYGPRFVFASHAFLTMFVAAALVALLRPLGRGVLWGAVAALVAYQGVVTVRQARELGLVIYQGTALDRAARALEAAIAPRQAVVMLLSRSGSIPSGDLVRNDPDRAAPVLFVQGRADRLPRTLDRLPGRDVYYWDGAGGVPALWTANPELQVQQVLATEPSPTIETRAPHPGWLAAVSDGGCDARRSVPGLRTTLPFAMGPCPGAGTTISVVTGSSWRFRRTGPLIVEVRGFFVAGDQAYDFAASSDAGYEVVLDGRGLIGELHPGAAQSKRARRLLRHGLHVISLVAWGPGPELHMELQLPADVTIFTQPPGR